MQDGTHTSNTKLREYIDDDVKVGDTHGFPIAKIGNVSSMSDSKVLVIENLMQIQCESSEELLAWV